MEHETTQPSRTREITEYLQAQPQTREQGQHLHVHHHYAPQPTGSAPVDQNPQQNVLERYTPYFIVGLFGMIILTGCGVIIYLLVSALAALMATVAMGLCAAAVAAIAVSSSIRNMRETPAPKKRIKK